MHADCRFCVGCIILILRLSVYMNIQCTCCTILTGKEELLRSHQQVPGHPCHCGHCPTEEEHTGSFGYTWICHQPWHSRLQNTPAAFESENIKCLCRYPDPKVYVYMLYLCSLCNGIHIIVSCEVQLLDVHIFCLCVIYSLHI